MIMYALTPIDETAKELRGDSLPALFQTKDEAQSLCDELNLDTDSNGEWEIAELEVN